MKFDKISYNPVGENTILRVGRGGVFSPELLFNPCGNNLQVVTCNHLLVVILWSGDYSCMIDAFR